MADVIRWNGVMEARENVELKRGEIDMNCYGFT